MSRALSNNPVLKKHREIDGITEAEFAELLKQCSSRAELYARYMALYVKRKKPGATRWFDKTPQNVYGALLAAASMPRSNSSTSFASLSTWSRAAHRPHRQGREPDRRLQLLERGGADRRRPQARLSGAGLRVAL
jgi:hypothetical protein